MSKPDTITVERAVAALTDAAQNDLPGVKARLEAAGFEIARYAPRQEPPSSGSAAIGQLIAGKGVFMGPWEPKDRTGHSLGKPFNVFAAPEDLKDASGKSMLLTFRDAARQVASLRNWNGHDGGNFNNDTALHRALGSDSYQGEWFIPPRDLLIGADPNQNPVRNESLYRNKDKGELNGTLTTTANDFHYGHWYLSSTEHRDFSSHVWAVSFSDGSGDWYSKDGNRLSCRPCRVEAASHLAL